MGPQGIGLEITELRLGLPGSGGGGRGGGEKKVDCCGGDVVVGWPPVCMYRRNSMNDGVRKMYVKVSMDGAPILRKVDLSSCKGYLELGMALEKLFGCSGIGEAMKEESESSEYVAIYEDKDGDWMLVGDVPWLMFTETCKRLRIKRRSYMNGSGLHGIPK